MAPSGRRVALLCRSPAIAQERDSSASLLNEFPSYGIRRVQAALVADPSLSDAAVTLIDASHGDPAWFLEQVLQVRPDVVGFSAYVWSTDLFVQVATRLKRALPQCTVLFGGPSAHPKVFECEPFRGPEAYLDALVLGEGEETFREVVRLSARDKDALRQVPGLAIPTVSGWFTTPKRVPNPVLDTIASPFQLGLMPHGKVAYLETFRGCPLSCSFCQWGVMESKRHFSVDYLTQELRSILEARPRYAFLVDAGLNLNRNAFKGLVAAEAEVGFFKKVPLLCEVYPSLLADEHLAFLSKIPHVHFGLGVQSLDEGVLRTISRPFRPGRLAEVVHQLSPYGLVDIEIILGLPGDTPETFRRTLEAVLELPCNVRVYKCLVLPDGLLTRSPPEHAVRFDPRTLLLTSCHTWSEEELRQTHAYMDRLAASTKDGFGGDYWWQFISKSPEYQRLYETAPDARQGSVESR